MADDDDVPQGAATNAATAAAAAATEEEHIAHAPAAALADAVINSSPFTLDRINDIIDFESEIIMLDRANRNAHYETLKFFWKLHPARNVKTGRRYARFLIAQLLSTACNCEPYSSSCRSSSKSHKKVNEQQQQQPALDQWSRQDWQRLQDDLQHLREVLIRQDAERNCDDATMAMDQQQQPQQEQQHHAEGENNDTLLLEAAEAAAIAAAIATATSLDVKRAQSPAFSTKYDTITVLLETQKALAPIRGQLEYLLYSKNNANKEEKELSTMESSVISLEEMQELSVYATSLTETRVSDLLLQLFEPATACAAAAVPDDESAEQQRRQPVLLSNRQELKDLLTTKAFDLVYLQEKLQTVLLRFNGEVYGKDVPVLLKLHYTLEDHNSRGPRGVWSQTHRRIMDRQTKRASQEFYKFILETEQKPRARFTAIRSSTIRKKPPPPPAVAAPTTRSSRAKKTRKQNSRDLDDDLNKQGVRAVKEESTRTPEGAAVGGTATRDDLVFGTPASTTTARTPTTTDDTKKGNISRGVKKRNRHQSDLLDLFDLDDKDDAIEAAKMSQGVKKSRVSNNASGRGGGAAAAASERGVSTAATNEDNPNSHRDLPPPDDGIFDEMGKVLRRIKWTDEEKNAVREGVKTLGVGKWMDVKKKYAFVLKNRTSVQIKDCYRTMSKNKEMETEGV